MRQRLAVPTAVSYTHLEEQLREPQNMRKLLSKVLPNPDNVELIRQRVYTHNCLLYTSKNGK